MKDDKRTANDIVDMFNAHFEVGTLVRFWKGSLSGAATGETRTRSAAQVLGGHTPVVWLEGVGGCIALSHVEVMELGSSLGSDGTKEKCDPEGPHDS